MLITSLFPAHLTGSAAILLSSAPTGFTGLIDGEIRNLDLLTAAKSENIAPLLPITLESFVSGILLFGEDGPANTVAVGHSEGGAVGASITLNLHGTTPLVVEYGAGTNCCAGILSRADVSRAALIGLSEEFRSPGNPPIEGSPSNSVVGTIH